MCAQIRHRGPDDEGVYIDGGCGIGMRRLSIIDLSTGHQPVSNEDGSVWVVFNGEIYNYQELRADLIRRGHRFSTNSDTETLVHLYEEKGADGLALLRGMFAFCIWDSKKRKILLARDRFGKKPLYYAALPGGLYFGSELKCLRAAGVPLEEDREALRLYFQFGYIPDPFSAFLAVKKLMPGCWLEYGMDGEIRHGRYWRMPEFTPGEPERLGHAETCARLRQSFDEAVRIRMIADVPLGAFLQRRHRFQPDCGVHGEAVRRAREDFLHRLRRGRLQRAGIRGAWWPGSTARTITRFWCGRIPRT